MNEKKINENNNDVNSSSSQYVNDKYAHTRRVVYSSKFYRDSWFEFKLNYSMISHLDLVSKFLYFIWE